MKKTLSFLTIVLAIVIHAQNINFPDPNFKAFLLAASSSNIYATNQSGAYSAIDINGDGEIQVTEAQNIRGLYINSYPLKINVQSIEGIKQFSNLKQLQITQTSITTADVSDLIKLWDLQLAPNNLMTSFNINGCTALQQMNLGFSNIANFNIQSNSLKVLAIRDFYTSPIITNINIQGCPNLEYLDIDRTLITALNLGNLSSLKTIYVLNNPNLNNINLTNSTNIQKITFDNNDSLTSLNLDNLVNMYQTLINNNNSLSNISLLNCPDLLELELNNNNLTTFNASQIPSIYYLSLNNNNLTSLNVSSNPVLRKLEINNNNISTLDLLNNPQLWKLSCSNTSINQINLSQNPLVTNLSAANNPNLQSINLKNGATNLSSFSISNSSNLAFICCDDNEIQTIINLGGSSNLSNTAINSYCNFNPGGTYYTIQGNTK